MTFSQFLLLAAWQDADKKTKYSINTFGVGMSHKCEGLGCRFWGSVGSLGVVSSGLLCFIRELGAWVKFGEERSDGK